MIALCRGELSTDNTLLTLHGGPPSSVCIWMKTETFLCCSMAVVAVYDCHTLLHEVEPR